ncbi:hypothetical protein PR048_017021 [Dryococelus australis]|uniref:Uncharacterized protein n=1 Tax=Dryococelus australis TaxID=614101 RepID=A0ABQ9H8I5_9NEOP|nr:hypothetical protein PR048_017021 [Dryococelus australis]
MMEVEGTEPTVTKIKVGMKCRVKNMRVELLRFHEEEMVTALNIAVLRVDEGEVRWVWSSAGMQGRGKWQSPEASSCTIPTCESTGAIPPGMEPGSQRWEAISVHRFSILEDDDGCDLQEDENDAGCSDTQLNFLPRRSRLARHWQGKVLATTRPVGIGEREREREKERETERQAA